MYRWLQFRSVRPAGSELQLGSSPVSSSCIVPDFVVSAITDPVGQWTVLLDFFSQVHLLAEGLYRTHFLYILLY